MAVSVALFIYLGSVYIKASILACIGNEQLNTSPFTWTAGKLG